MSDPVNPVPSWDLPIIKFTLPAFLNLLYAMRSPNASPDFHFAQLLTGYKVSPEQVARAIMLTDDPDVSDDGNLERREELIQAFFMARLNCEQLLNVDEWRDEETHGPFDHGWDGIIR